MLKDHGLETEESELREDEPERQRLMMIGLLIFSLGFCALVFSAGWKEVSAYERCGLHGVLTVGRGCLTGH
jgi:hypothetical protein